MEKLVELLKAPHLGIREARLKLSDHMNEGSTTVLTVNGRPRKVIVSYDEMVELLATVIRQQNQIDAKGKIEDEQAVLA